MRQGDSGFYRGAGLGFTPYRGEIEISAVAAESRSTPTGGRRRGGRAWALHLGHEMGPTRVGEVDLGLGAAAEGNRVGPTAYAREGAGQGRWGCSGQKQNGRGFPFYFAFLLI